MPDYLPIGRGQGHVTLFKILYPLKYLCNGYSYRLQMLYTSWPCEVIAVWWLIAPPQVGVVRITWHILDFYTLWNSSARLQLETSNFVYYLAAWSISLWCWLSRKWVWSGSRGPILHFGAQAISLEQTKLNISNLVCRLNVKTTGVMLKFCSMGGAFIRSRDLLKFSEISANISEMVQDRHIVTRLTGNYIYPIKWHQHRWPWVTLNVTLAVSKLF